MKRLTNYIFLAFFLLAGLGSCYEDKGNYDYDEIFEVGVSGLENSYLCYSMIDSLNIVPAITPSEEEYDCFWGVYLTNVQGYAPKLDTICHTRELHMLVELAPSTYKLVFGAKERRTGIANIKQADLEVTTPLSTGWYVLRSQDGMTDLDLFSPRGKIEHVIARNNGGYSLKGEACCLDRMGNYKAWDETNERYINTNTLVALSDGDAVTLRLSDGTIIRDFETLFYDIPSERNPQVIHSNLLGNLYLMNAGKVHTIYGMSANSGRFGVPKSGDYALSPYCVGHMIWAPVMFDTKTSSFCTADTYGNSIIYFKDEKTSIPSNNMGVDLIFMGAGAGKDWALVRKQADGEFQLLNLNPNAARGRYADLITSREVISPDLGLVQAYCWAPNLTNNIIYFVKGNTIGSCNIDGGMMEKEQYRLPAGEKVTYMRNLTYRNWKNPTQDFNVLAVATEKGGEYKVYLFDIQAGNLKDEPEVLTGKGKVGALVFVDKNNSTDLY